MNPTETSYAPTGAAQDVTVAGNYAYVAGLSNGMKVVDISNPTDPIVAGTYDIETHMPYAIEVIGRYVYLADYSAGLHIVDISDPTDPVGAGYYDTLGPYDLDVVEDRIYLADNHGGVAILQFLPYQIHLPLLLR
jgi:hypothetical protein